ncbi:hypothetical protein BVRB_8g183500 [Beta vulgaris subsp. vulgaris]|nr:hypothetical protein BVRB_8g183500 [Beta vulgaris subsp. vulgaris]
MKTLNFQHPDFHFLSKIPSISKTPIYILHYKCLLNPQKTIFSSLRTSSSTNSATSCNGWDDYTIWVNSDELGESTHLKKFLISSGFNDKKYLFTCILGFVCALAISRVRVSSIIIFPAAAIVFAIGFSFGFSNGKSHKWLSLNGVKSRVKDDSFRIYAEKLNSLIEIFDGFDVKLSDLKDDMKRVIENERVDFSDLESYVNAVEVIGGLVVNARNVVEYCIVDKSVDVQEVEKNPKQKNSRKKKDTVNTGNKGFNLFGFMGSFVKGNAGDSKSSRSNLVSKDILAKDVGNQCKEDLRAAEGALDPAPTMDGSIRSRTTSGDGDRKNRLDGRDHETKRTLQKGKMNTMKAYMNTENFLNADEYKYENIRFTSNQRFSLNMSAHEEFGKWAPDDSISSNTDFDISKELSGNVDSLNNRQVFQNSKGAYESSEQRESINFGRFRAGMSEERLDIEDELHSRKYRSQSENDIGSFTSSAVSDDMLFDKCLRKAKELLKQAKECLKARNDESVAEEMLHESAKLLGQAIALKPMSLLAIGQLGNTYLLHGELKLKISRELRVLLSKSDDLGVGRSNIFILEDTFPSKDRIENLLISSCEESEAFLVEAGRKYRMALSLDGNDVRALYNWGLALSFRAQLISDVGPEAALDADKLFMAAIDKFNAMMSKSNDYAPEALFRWGMALQQRSRLRLSNSSDKVKLLQQAKRLYEDAVNLGSNNLQVRKALSSCISELNFTDI